MVTVVAARLFYIDQDFFHSKGGNSLLAAC